MPFNSEARSRLQKFVTAARSVIEKDFCRQMQKTFGLDPESGHVSDISSLHHLNTTNFETACDFREIFTHYQNLSPASGEAAILKKILREQTQTFLHRICAIRMAEERGVIPQSLSSGMSSVGFVNYKVIVRSGFSTEYETYQRYLKSLFDEEAGDLPQIFDRTEPFGILFLEEPAFMALLDLINAGDLEPFWSEDETIGWIFQYFNNEADFSEMRGQQNKNPKNSHELAVRNQFFTPRYVVEFLLDNTLGRVWAEETKGQTRLLKECCYLLLKKQDDIGKLESLRDPRTIRMLDPACGSMHFGLYAFDLFKRIYEEAWDWLCSASGRTLRLDLEHEKLKPLNELYSSKEEFLRFVPSMIIEFNIYGVDIDVRATQIASLALWLRAQKELNLLGIPSQDRPEIGRGNVVAAMAPPPERDVRLATEERFGGDVEEGLKILSLDMLSLIPETGILLKLEKNLDQSEKLVPDSFEGPDLFGMSHSTIWAKQKSALDRAMKDYIDQAGHSFKEQLYARDAIQCMNLIDLCTKKFDAIVMNPPFGSPADGSRSVLGKLYPTTKKEIIGMFVQRMLELIRPEGYVGTISSRTIFFQGSSEKWREEVLFKEMILPVFADLGLGVMDNALVESAAYVLGKRKYSNISVFIDASKEENKGFFLREKNAHFLKEENDEELFIKDLDEFSSLPGKVLAYNASDDVIEAYKGSATDKYFDVKVGTQTSDNYRYVRLGSEIESAKKLWVPLAKGGEANPFYGDISTYINWEEDGEEIKKDICIKYPYLNGNYSFVVKNESSYFRPGLTWSFRAKALSLRVMPKDCIFDHVSSGVFSKNDDLLDILCASAILNSRAYQNVMSVQLQRATGDSHYECGMLASAPYPEDISKETRSRLADLAEINFCARRRLDSVNEESHAFILPEMIQTGNGDLDRDAELQKIQSSQVEMDLVADELYGFTSKTIVKQEKSRIPYTADKKEQVHRLLMWAVGVAFGRFDIRLAIGDRDIPEETKPFAPYPKLSPGRLPEGEFEFITNAGIFASDPSAGAMDLGNAVRSVLDEAYPDFDADVSEWLRKEFFPFHLKTYSGAQRVAPIYWPIGTESGSYVLWLYYPKLSEQMLWAALNDFIEPKMKAVNFRCDELKIREADLDSKGREELQEMQDLAKELSVLQKEVESLAKTFKVHFDDGVALNAVRLRHLIPKRGIAKTADWLKKLNDTAKALDKGELDWSETAADLYPERVMEACKKNESIALAHKFSEIP